jgi:hypothetical protein
MCVLFVSLVRVPSMKVSAAVLGSLFLYDIFWVYLSHHFFGENVMYRPPPQPPLLPWSLSPLG